MKFDNTLILQIMSEGLVVQNHLGEIIQFNPSALHILGLSEEQLMGRTSFDPRWRAIKSDGSPFPGEEHPAIVALRTGQSIFGAVMGLMLPSEQKKWIQINAVPIGEGEDRFVVCTFSEITKLIQTELQLKEAQSIAKIGSWSYDLRTRTQEWSSEHYRIFEIEEPQSQEKLHELYRSRIHPEDLPKLDFIIQNAIQKGEDFIYNHRVYLDSGSRTKYVRGIGKVSKNENGQPISISGTCQDLTDLVSLQEQNRFILDAMGIGIWKFNPISQELIWDESMYRLFGISSTDFSGDYQAWESSLSQEAKAQAIEELRLALTGEKEFNTTFEIQTKSGQRKNIGGRGVVIRNVDQQPMMMYGINWDRTKDVEYEKKLQMERSKAAHSSKLASLGELSAGIAHEINNPLAIILSSLPMLARYKSDSTKFEHRLESAQKSAQRIAKIIKGLLRFSRYDEQKKHLPIDLYEIVQESILLIAVKLQKYDVQLEIVPFQNIEILCDSVEIEQVIVNLLSNAIDATKGLQDRIIKIECFREDKNVVLRVIDSGRGLSLEIENKIFDPFFTTKVEGEGTGLGLSIVKGIVESHHGTISINRNVKGTCFEIVFPSI